MSTLNELLLQSIVQIVEFKVPYHEPSLVRRSRSDRYSI